MSLFIDFGMWAYHSGLRCCTFLYFNALTNGLTRSLCRILLQLYFWIFRHPETRLDPLLFGHTSDHSSLPTLHVEDSLCIVTRLSVKLSQSSFLCRHLSLSQAHLDCVKLLDLSHYFLLLLFRFSHLSSPLLDFFKLFLLDYLLALLDQILSDAVFTE